MTPPADQGLGDRGVLLRDWPLVRKADRRSANLDVTVLGLAVVVGAASFLHPGAVPMAVFYMGAVLLIAPVALVDRAWPRVRILADDAARRDEFFLAGMTSPTATRGNFGPPIILSVLVPWLTSAISGYGIWRADLYGMRRPGAANGFLSLIEVALEMWGYLASAMAIATACLCAATVSLYRRPGNGFGKAIGKSCVFAPIFAYFLMPLGPFGPVIMLILAVMTWDRMVRVLAAPPD